MDYSRTALADRLAADYVMGTLRGPARRRFESLLPAHPALRAAVGDWQRRLAVLSADVVPVEPSPAVWRQVQRRLFDAGPASAPQLPADGTRWWQRLGLWQGLATAATVAALALGVALQQPPAVQPPVVIVMGSTDPAAADAPAQFVASLSGDGRSLVLKPLAGATLSAAQALELWAVPADGAPRSLGLVSARHATTVVRAAMLENTAALALSVEPTGGSPTGLPTGPIISLGKLQL
jgi:anti-sigma-K factor RskA